MGRVITTYVRKLLNFVKLKSICIFQKWFVLMFDLEPTSDSFHYRNAINISGSMSLSYDRVTFLSLIFCDSHHSNNKPLAEVITFVVPVFTSTIDKYVSLVNWKKNLRRLERYFDNNEMMKFVRIDENWAEAVEVGWFM